MTSKWGSQGSVRLYFPPGSEQRDKLGHIRKGFLFAKNREQKKGCVGANKRAPKVD